MHDIDQVRLETESETGLYETGFFESEFGETEALFLGESGVFSETQEMELASEMLEIMSEAELDRFLGDLIKRAGGAIGKFVSSPAGKAIGGVLKGAAKQVLPALGSAVGGYFGGPAGAKLGGQAASAAGGLFGLELEGLSAEDREFELARHYVRFAGQAVKNLALDQTGQDPRTAANNATVLAAQTLAPGLLRPTTGPALPPATSVSSASLPGQSGRWVRRGSRIVLYGI